MDVARLLTPHSGLIGRSQGINQSYHATRISANIKMKWKHALDEGLGAVKKGIEVYHTGKALWEVGKMIVPLLI